MTLRSFLRLADLVVKGAELAAPHVRKLAERVGLVEPPGVPLPHRNVDLIEEQIRQATSHKVGPPPKP